VTDSDRRRLLDELHAHLEATEELPVHPSATHWIAEAQAVAADLAEAVECDTLPDEVIRARVGHVRDLLERVERTENPAVDEHLNRALRLSARLSESSTERGEGG
jgi:hypothetical protein